MQRGSGRMSVQLTLGIGVPRVGVEPTLGGF